MIKSIRYFLLISLLLSITLASAINGVGNYLLDEKVVQPYLDSQLSRTASLIEMLYHSSTISPKERLDIIASLKKAETNIGKKFLFQVWKGNKLVLYTYEAAPLSLENVPSGFSDKNIDGNDWRIYSTFDADQKIKVVIAEQYNLRRELADDIAHSNAKILLITYPVFGILVWVIVSIALRSIIRVANEISHRASSYLEPMELTEIPVEIKPLVAELNQLFIRLKHAFQRNKRFAADAAHELKTPLAALKTHLQIALMAETEEDRAKALQNVIQGVDRSTHVVTQLLTLSRLGEEDELSDLKPVDLHKLATEIIAYLAPHAFEKNIDIELIAPDEAPIVLGNDIALGILIRNIVDNAIRYTPQDGAVTVEVLSNPDLITLRVVDTGDGIPDKLKDRVFERFYRILGSKAPGSGLGLAIVQQIASLHHATINLDSPSHGKGLQFDVAFPRYHV